MRELTSPSQLIKSTPLFIMLLLSVLVFFLPNADDFLVFDRNLVIAKEWYRVFSSALVHNNIHHLWMNVLGAIVVYMLFAEYFTIRNQLIFCLLCNTLIGIALFQFSSIEIYMGLSAYLHGIFAWAVVLDLCTKRFTAFVLAGLGVFKLVYEQIAEPEAVSDSLIQISVAIDAHLYGSIVGVVSGFAYVIYKKTRQSST